MFGRKHSQIWVEGFFCLFPFPALAGTDYRQAEVPKQRKMGAKIKSFIPKVTSINIYI